MRGAAHWAVAVRRPAGDVYVESHPIEPLAARHPLASKPFLRGVMVLGQSLVIGTRAMMVAANQSMEDDDQLSSKQVGISLAVALVLFVAIFILGPTALFAWAGHHYGNSRWILVLEGVFRVALLVGYLWLIGRFEEVRRVFQYHGAEHKTIAAYEHDEPLDPAHVDRFPKEHVRCGTNFLIIVMIVTILVFTVIGTPGIWWRIGSRLVAIPVIAGIAYEALRLGARFPNSPLVRALMMPGIWLQKVATLKRRQAVSKCLIPSFRRGAALRGGAVCIARNGGDRRPHRLSRPADAAGSLHRPPRPEDGLNPSIREARPPCLISIFHFSQVQSRSGAANSPPSGADTTPTRFATSSWPSATAWRRWKVTCAGRRARPGPSPRRRRLRERSRDHRHRIPTPSRRWVSASRICSGPRTKRRSASSPRPRPNPHGCLPRPDRRPSASG